MTKKTVVTKVTQMVEGTDLNVGYIKRKYIVRKASPYLYYTFRTDWRLLIQGSLEDVLEYMLREED